MNVEKVGLVATANELGLSWAQSHLQGPNAIDLGCSIRVYFTTRHFRSGLPVSLPGYFDVSKKNLLEVTSVSQHPVLETGDLGHFDHDGIYPASVLETENGFLMAYGGWSRPESTRFDVAIGMAVSQSGDSFTKIAPGPVLQRTLLEPFILSSPKLRQFNGTFYMFYISGQFWSRSTQRLEPTYRIRLASSLDLKNWKREKVNLIPSLTPMESQAAPDVFRLEDQYHMLFSYRDSLNYMSGAGSYRIGHATSKDLVNWHRSSDPFPLNPGTKAWDSDMVAYPNVIKLGSELILFYSGNGVGETGVGVARVTLDSN